MMVSGSYIDDKIFWLSIEFFYHNLKGIMAEILQMRTLRRIFIEGKLKKIIGIVIWKSLIDYMFAEIVTDVYAYMNQIADYNYKKLAISWIILFVFYALGKLICAGMVRFSFDFLFVLSFIPTLTVWWAKNEDNRCMALVVLYWFIWGLVSICITRSPKYRLFRLLKENESGDLFEDLVIEKNEKFNKGAVMVMFIICALSTIFFSYRYGGMRLFVGLGDVYNYRNVAGNNMSSIEAYLYNWMVSIVLPIILLFFITNKKRVLAVLCCVLISMNYAIYGNKAMLFMILLTFCIAIISQINFSEHLIVYSLVGANIATFLSCVLQKTGITVWGVALIDRMTTGIAAAHFHYYDFFQNHEYLLLRQSILRFISTDPYGTPVSIIIGSSAKYNLSGNYNNLNNGVFSDAYANLGVVGVVVYPIVFVGAIYLFEKILKDITAPYKYLILCWLLLYCMSIGFFQWLLSGGFIIAIILLRFYKKYKFRR